MTKHVHETAWNITAAECTANDNGTETLLLGFQSEDRAYVVSVTGAGPLMLKQAINAFRAGAAHLCLQNGIEVPDARRGNPDDMPPADGVIN
jgi:hypothetical protein